ncbi:alpha/beta hydrolase [Paenibacillus sp. FSL R7-0273]|uniref:alpha/beta hydrolase n=1 Tax=Paenibacillus sp. FSL R7-0273 TaxID=1536772 RepID=UPI0004F7BA81|nr:alpha/beta hydrolase [Paenibacillus sp. FSL R7-0273]AIQ47379.1 alpha/beta hydrolase [Paenibacillus sp. FSL R7-0273]OMF96065.1 alpha/beta hydrolase [Paenibacillus sp. FSL R7-0273]
MIQPAGAAVQNRSTAKKVLHIVLKIIAAFIILVLLFIAVVFTVNKASSYSEQKRTDHYGQLVPVDGKQMNVFIEGQGKETIVLLPGYGTAAPALDFKPLISELSPYYKVVVVEPFGYGLSDQTGKERTTANIVSEIHEALQSLHIDRYILMAHSISGLYSLDYVNQYSNEVSAYIGLDSSVPALREQRITSSDTKPVKWFRDLGFARVQLKLSPDAYEGLPYDEHTLDQINILMRKNMYNPTQLNEAVSMYANYDAAEQQSFPANLPVLFFLQENHPVTDQWVPEHEKQIEDSLQGEIILLDADHYLYRSHSAEISEKIRGFTDQNTNRAL